MLEEQLQQLRSQAKDAKAAAQAESDRLEADGRRIAREAQHLLDLGDDVRLPLLDFSKSLCGYGRTPIVKMVDCLEVLGSLPVAVTFDPALHSHIGMAVCCSSLGTSSRFTCHCQMQCRCWLSSRSQEGCPC